MPDSGRDTRAPLSHWKILIFYGRRREESIAEGGY
jgi:hypothetical protein